MSYKHIEIEKKWQRYWEEHKTFKTTEDNDKKNYYALDMFPYPSGQGLHVGHPEGYTATDIMARMKRMQGYNVLHPMGWDAFGLPAEQYALNTGNSPREFTKKNVNNFRRQIKSLGLSYDWDREVNTTDPAYYKWTQWIFEQLYKKGLAYEAEVPVNWSPDLGTVVANEEVIDGKTERGGFPVIRKPMRQWVLKITAYADRLIDDLDDLDWPEAIKEQQRNWIGRSVGAAINFPVSGDENTKNRACLPLNCFALGTFIFISVCFCRASFLICRLPIFTPPQFSQGLPTIISIVPSTPCGLRVIHRFTFLFGSRRSKLKYLLYSA